MTQSRGRPRSFDVEAALDQAMLVFWQQGYQNASLAELTAAMGLNKPSLYAAFGDKEALYLKALARYVDQRVGAHFAVLETETEGRIAVERFLQSMVDMLSEAPAPGGCFIVNGTLDCGSALMPRAIEAALHEAVRAGEAKLLVRLQRARREGEIPADVNIEDLTAVFYAVLSGLTVLARNGAGRGRLSRVASGAMAMWPSA